jgi:hypothetical protein
MDVVDGNIAYFSAEFGIYESLPIYSGGLGVVVEDYLKASNDLQIPVRVDEHLLLSGGMHIVLAISYCLKVDGIKCPGFDACIDQSRKSVKTAKSSNDLD